MPAGVPDQHWVERTEANASMAVRDVIVMSSSSRAAVFLRRTSHSFFCVHVHTSCHWFWCLSLARILHDGCTLRDTQCLHVLLLEQLDALNRELTQNRTKALKQYIVIGQTDLGDFYYKRGVEDKE
jgi:hypothetical protein